MGADHYYWLTAFLAARSMQTATCRVIAAMTLGLGVMPLALVASSASVRTVPHWLVATAVLLCCTVIAAMWWRPGWPTRVQSQTAAVTGAGCIAVACLLPTEPLVGILGCTAFLMQTVFVGFFHSARLMAVIWAVAAAVLIVLGVREAPVSVTVAVCAVVLLASINGFAAFACVMVIKMLDTQIRHDIEPLTGLLTRDAFFEKVLTLIGARSRNDDLHLVIAVLDLDGYSALLSMSGVAGAHRARITVGHQLRETLRRDTVLAHVGETEFLVAELFTQADPHPLLERMRGTVTNPPSRLTASIGAVIAPLSPLRQHGRDDVLEELLTLASSAMYEARKAGGNQIRPVLNPTLTTLNDPTHGGCGSD